MIGPPERKSRPGGGGSDLASEVTGGVDRNDPYTRTGEKETAAELRASALSALSSQQRHDLDSVAFWMRPERLPFFRRWEAQPGGREPRPLVCYGNLPGQFDHAVWLWQPSGYLLDFGTTWMRSGPEVAEKIARMIPGAEVLDCRDAEYGELAA